MKSWADLDWWKTKEWTALEHEICNGREGYDYFPKKTEIFRAFVLTRFQDVRVIILGQSPYQVRGMSDGLAFSTSQRRSPPTLKNIFTEYVTDLGYARPQTNDLSPWAKNGVLLLNTRLTSSPILPMSKAMLKWSVLTKEVIKKVHEYNPDVVFLAWGEATFKTISDLNLVCPNIIYSSHPSDYTARSGFFGSRPFSKCNSVLATSGLRPINWELQ